jgi:hypothetical protein
MIDVKMSQDLNAAPQEVWEVIGGFNALPDFHPMVKASRLEEGGTVRCLTLPDGARLWERLLHFDEEKRTYSYSIERFEGLSLPFRNYRSSFTLKDGPKPGTSTLHWQGTAEAAPGARKEDAVAFVEAVYKGGFKGLIKRFGAPS